MTPHFGVKVQTPDGEDVEILQYDQVDGIVSEETSKTMRMLLEKVVSEGSGKNAKIEGYAIGGKTATSQTLPRSAHKYISSFLGFAPAEEPTVLCLVIINDPQGVYYGVRSQLRCAKKSLKIFCPIWKLKNRITCTIT